MSPTPSHPLSTEYQAYKIYLLFSRYQNSSESRKGKLMSPCAVTGRKKCCWGCSAHRSFPEGNWRTARRNYCLHMHLSYTLTTTQGVPSIIPALIWGVFATHFQERKEQMPTVTWEAYWTCVWQQLTFHCTSHRNTQFPLPAWEQKNE